MVMLKNSCYCRVIRLVLFKRFKETSHVQHSLKSLGSKDLMEHSTSSSSLKSFEQHILHTDKYTVQMANELGNDSLYYNCCKNLAISLYMYTKLHCRSVFFCIMVTQNTLKCYFSKLKKLAGAYILHCFGIEVFTWKPCISNPLLASLVDTSSDFSDNYKNAMVSQPCSDNQGTYQQWCISEMKFQQMHIYGYIISVLPLLGFVACC